jgi:hypothetical protein
VKSKRSSRASAADLYISPLFVGRRRAVESTCDRWYVLSALHGLVSPDAVIEPYDRTLNDSTVAERRAWSSRVINDLVRELGSLSGLEFEIHAGASYVGDGLVEGLQRRGADVEVPLEGMPLDRQLAFYARSRPPQRG